MIKRCDIRVTKLSACHLSIHLILITTPEKDDIAPSLQMKEALSKGPGLGGEVGWVAAPEPATGSRTEMQAPGPGRKAQGRAGSEQPRRAMLLHPEMPTGGALQAGHQTDSTLSPGPSVCWGPGTPSCWPAWHHLSSQTIMLSLRYPLTGLLTPESLVPYPNHVAHWSLRV